MDANGQKVAEFQANIHTCADGTILREQKDGDKNVESKEAPLASAKDREAEKEAKKKEEEASKNQDKQETKKNEKIEYLKKAHTPEESEKLWNETLEKLKKMDPNDTVAKLDVLIPALRSSGIMSRNVPIDANKHAPDYTGTKYEKTHGYDIDGTRTAEQIIKEGLAGSCGSFGKVIADALIKTGTPAEKVHLVDTVGASEKGSQDAKGHQFVLVQGKDNNWQLVNSTADKTEAIPFDSPKALQEKLNKEELTHVESFAKKANGESVFPALEHAKDDPKDEEVFKDLLVFDVQRADQYKNHDIKQRVEKTKKVF